MNKIFTFSALGLVGLGLAGCSMQEQTYPTTASVSPMESSLKKPVQVAAPTLPKSLVAADKKVVPFSLPDAAGNFVKVGNWDKSKATAIMFVATQCPVSNAYNARMETLAKNYSAKGVKFVGINSNKQESNREIAEHSRENGFTFSVLKDKGNVIADGFDAKVTPEIYLVNA